MNDKPLLVPVILQALLVGKPDAGRFSALSIDFSSLDSTPFGKDAVRQFFSTKPENTGIHLHWTMPDALLHGEQDENNNMRFPALPNRWIVQRLSAGAEDISRKVWIIYSDCVTYESDDDYDVIPLDVAVPRFLWKNGEWIGGGPEGELYGWLGRRWEFGSQPDAPKHTLEELTAVGTGDPVFAAFYQRSRSVFGFYDDMSKEKDGAQYTYIVSGYYSNPEKDPLNAATTKTLDTLGWRTDAVGVLPNATICHGMVHSVLWRGENHSYDGGQIDKDVEIYVGNTSVDALSALICKKISADRDFERILTALQFQFLKELENMANPDAAIAFEDILHDKQFMPVFARYTWNIRKLDGSVEDAVLDKALHSDIQQLRALQAQIDSDGALTRSFQHEAFFAWWKYVMTMLDPYGENALKRGFRHKLFACAPKYSASAKEYLDMTRNLLESLAACRKRVKDGCAAVDSLASKVNAALKKYRLQIMKEQSAQLYTAYPPALMLAGEGANRAYKQGFQKSAGGGLRCRMATIREVAVDTDKEIVHFSVADVKKIMKPELKNLPPFIEDIAAEAALFSFPFTNCLAAAKGYAGTELAIISNKLLEQMKKRIGYTGTLPELFSTALHEQPWAPLLMVWETSIRPARLNISKDDSFKQYVLKEIDFEPLYEPFPASKEMPLIVQGCTLIAPHAVIHAQEAIQRLIEDGDIDEERRKKLLDAAQRLGQLNILSQRIDGFNEALLMRDNAPFLPLCGISEDPEEKKVVASLNALVEGYLLSPRIENVKSLFLPIRAGGLNLKRLWLVDSFGRYKAVNTDKTNIFLSECLDMTDDGILMRPRIMQACAVNMRWLSYRYEEMVREFISAYDQYTTPIFGFIVPNFLERCLQVYGADGDFFGLVQQSGHGAKWMNILNEGIQPDEIKCKHLSMFVSSLLGEKNSALGDMLAAVNDLFSYSVPDGSDEFMQLCFGRPLVLARAAIGIDPDGMSPHVQEWSTQFSCNEFDREKIPVRIGDKRKLADGVVGFYVDGIDEKHCYRRFNCQTSVTTKYVRPSNTVYTTLSSGELRLTLLLDPTCAVNVVTGYLPCYKTVLDRELYRQQLESMDLMFRLAPILQEQDAFALPLPGNMDEGWRFLRMKEDGITVEEIDEIIPPSVLLPTIRQVSVEGFMNYRYHKKEE